MPGIRCKMLCNFNIYIFNFIYSNIQIQKSSSIGPGNHRIKPKTKPNTKSKTKPKMKYINSYDHLSKYLL